jgi:hypothetical protein
MLNRFAGLFAPVAVLVGALVGCSSSPAPRAARSQAVPDRVAELCAGVPQAEWERPYFLQQDGIEAVRELAGEQRSSKFGKLELRGAEIAVRPSAEGTRHRISRLLRCHLAWHDAVGFSDTESFEDPLSVGLPEVSIDETQAGFVMRIAGHDQAEGEEILRRAEALISPSASARE